MEIDSLPAEADDRVVDALGLLVALADRLVLGAPALAHLKIAADYWEEAEWEVGGGQERRAVRRDCSRVGKLR